MNQRVENVIINGSDLLPGDEDLIFGNWKNDPIPEIHYSDATDIQTLMVEVGVYSSKSHAKRDGRVGPIPPGYTELKASKIRRLYIWNPRNQ